MNPIEAFIAAIDAAWPGPPAPRIELRVLGSSSLFLQCDYRRGTKDSDVIETAQVSGDVLAALKDLAGKGTPLHERHRLYLDVLAARFPFLPPEPMWWPMDELTGRLTHFSVAVLDPTDVVISKLPRFHANDVQDIRAVILRGLVDHGELVARFRQRSTASRWTRARTTSRSTCVVSTRSSVTSLASPSRRSSFRRGWWTSDRTRPWPPSRALQCRRCAAGSMSPRRTGGKRGAPDAPCGLSSSGNAAGRGCVLSPAQGGSLCLRQPELSVSLRTRRSASRRSFLE